MKKRIEIVLNNKMLILCFFIYFICDGFVTHRMHKEEMKALEDLKKRELEEEDDDMYYYGYNEAFLHQVKPAHTDDDDFMEGYQMGKEDRKIL